MLGFLGDVGDLAKLVQGKAGSRPRQDLDGSTALDRRRSVTAVDCNSAIRTPAAVAKTCVRASTSDGACAGSGRATRGTVTAAPGGLVTTAAVESHRLAASDLTTAVGGSSVRL